METTRIDSEELRKLAEHIYEHAEPRVRDHQVCLSEFAESIPEPQVSYSQNWPLYDQACRREKLMFLKIIKASVEHLNLKYIYKGNGRPPAYYGDIVKCLLIKAYHNYSSWRAESEFKICKAMGIIDGFPKRATVNKYMQDTKITAMLQDLLKLIAQPLATIETSFAADATGIQRKYGNARWTKVRHTKDEPYKLRDYRKLHVVAGCKTNVICAARITEGSKHESPLLPKLLLETKENFNPKHVCADAGYLSRNNVNFIRYKIKSKPWIMPKKNTSAFSKGRMTAWNAMFYIFREHQDVFAEHYHLRSNVESTFSALKRKFGDFCRCKKPETTENEILCKVVCFNAVILAETLLLEDIKIPFMEY